MPPSRPNERHGPRRRPKPSRPRPPGDASTSNDGATLPRIHLKIERTSDQPFVYRKMIRPADLAPGEIVEAVDRTGRTVGSGFYNPRSQIALRLLSDDPARPVTDAWLRQRLRAAVRLRSEGLRLPERTDAMRLVHAEADGLSGLIVDRFGRFVVCELFSAGWYRWLKTLLHEVAAAVAEAFGGDPTVLVRADREVEALEGFKVRDFVAEQLADSELRPVITEDGVQFRVDLRHGHKTGFFCDQRDNRHKVAELAVGRRLLDTFCYTGGFSCRALRAGAASALAIDLDERAIALAHENAALNEVAERFEARHADAFGELRALHRANARFDVIVLDPPKLAASKDELADALHAYEDIVRLAIPLMALDAVLVTNSCSGLVSEGALLSAVRRAANSRTVTLQHLWVTGAAPDHPVASHFPEGRYLKTIYSRMLAP